MSFATHKNMIIKKFIKGSLRNNNYLIIDEASHEAALIDCSDAPADIVAFLKENKAKLKYILLTHGHFDHMLGVSEIQKATKALSFLYYKDKLLVEHIDEFMDSLGFEHVTPPKIDVFFDNKTQFTLGDQKIQVIPTAGHSEGGVCYLIQKYLFSGDTLFYETHGRTDLQGSNSLEMHKSLEKLLTTLDDDIIVYPGHGFKTTIGHEKEFYGLKKRS